MYHSRRPGTAVSFFLYLERRGTNISLRWKKMSSLCQEQGTDNGSTSYAWLALRHTVGGCQTRVQLIPFYLQGKAVPMPTQWDFVLPRAVSLWNVSLCVCWHGRKTVALTIAVFSVGSAGRGSYRVKPVLRALFSKMPSVIGRAWGKALGWMHFP